MRIRLPRLGGVLHALGGQRRVRRIALWGLVFLGLTGAWLPSCVPVPAEREAAARSISRSPGSLELAAAVGDAAAASVEVRVAGAAGAMTIEATPSAPWLEVEPASLTLEGGEGAELTLRARCGELQARQVAWVLLEAAVEPSGDAAGEAAGDAAGVASGGAAEAIYVRLACRGSAAAAEPSDALLHWAPPALDDPVLLRLGTEPGALQLDPTSDYLIVLPDEPLTRGMNVAGGRNVVVIGGEIAIPWQGVAPSIASRRAVHVTHATGVVHLEGLLLHGEDISEGIQINAPDAIVQIQQVGVFGIRARDQVGFTDNHPDLVQSYGNAREVRIDRFTGTTDYQGLFFQADHHGPAHGPVTLRRINVVGEPTARYLLWFPPRPGSGDVTLEEVYLDVPPERSGGLGRAVWPDVEADAPARARVADGGREAVGWPEGMTPRIRGLVYGGRPPGGDFVSAASAGIGYLSSGYRLAEDDTD